jgi:hypothetical protein
VKTPLYLTILLAGLAVAALLTVQPYSAPSRWNRYAGAAERYLEAALRQDSVALAKQSLSTAPVSWGLHAGRAHPRALAVWSRYAHPSLGFQHGDTAIVYLETATEVCSQEPIVLHFVGTGKRTRVLQASSACFELP